MNNFNKDNIILTLALAGAILSFLVVLTQKIARRSKLKISIILAACILLVVSGQQIVKHIEKKNESLQNAAFEKSQELMKQTRIKIVDDIRENVLKTKSLLENLSDELLGKLPWKIGIQVFHKPFPEKKQFTGYQEKSLTDKKANPWPDYTNWLKNIREKDGFLSLSLTLNKGNMYSLNLILFWLFTNEKTIPFLRDMPIYRLFSFPSKSFLYDFLIPEPEIKYVLFYDREPEVLIGYASAGNFSKELLLYLQTKNQELVEGVLNSRSTNPEAVLSKYFRSFKTEVFRGSDAYLIAKKMIDQKYTETIVIDNDKLYFVNITDIIGLAN